MPATTALFLTATIALVATERSSEPTKPVGGGVAGVSCSCPADFDGNGSIDGADLAAILGGWGSPNFDLDGNGTTDAADLSVVLGSWGFCIGTPSNDRCQNALPITEGETPFCTFGAGTEAPAYSPGSGCAQFGYNSVYADVWYSFTAPDTGLITLSTCGTNWDTRLAVYKGDECPTSELSLSELVACNDDHSSCGNGSLVYVYTTPGTEYKIRVGGYNGWSGEGVLQFDFDPIGGNCSEAIDLGITNGAFLNGSTIPYDAGEDQSPCALGDVTAKWYMFAVDCGHQNGTITLSTCHEGTDFDTTLSVWRAGPVGCPGTFLACNDDFASPTCQISGFNRKSRIEIPWEEPAYYYVRVSGYNGAKGDFQLSIDVNCN
jgi:hypothetical protein